MDNDDHLTTSGESEDTPPAVVPTHDQLPLPPDVHYTRPNSPRRTDISVNRYSDASTSGDPSPGVRYTGSLAGSINFAASILAGYWLGSKIDAHWIHASTPWGTIVMVVAGAGVGFYNMIRIAGRSERNKK